MVMRDFDTLWDRKTYISIKENFKELFNYYIKSGLDAAEAREKAIQAVADAEIAKETAETTREEMLAIIREQTQNGDLAPEIAQARQGKETLGENLNSIKSDLAQNTPYLNNGKLILPNDFPKLPFNIFKNKYGDFYSDANPYNVFDWTDAKQIYITSQGSAGTGESYLSPTTLSNFRSNFSNGVYGNIKKFVLNVLDFVYFLNAGANNNITIDIDADILVRSASADKFTWFGRVKSPLLNNYTGNWIANSGVYVTTQTTSHDVLDVVNLTVLDEFKMPAIYTKVNSLSECQSTKGSFYRDGSDCYCNPYDNHNINDVILVVSTGVFNINQTFARTLIFENCGFLPSSFQTGTIDNINARFYTFGCKFHKALRNGMFLSGAYNVHNFDTVASHATLDAFNYHTTDENSLATEVNCIGFAPGKMKLTTGQPVHSNNGSTAHDGMYILRVGSRYYDCEGPIVADADNCYSISIGVEASGILDSTTGVRAAFYFYDRPEETPETAKPKYVLECKGYGENVEFGVIGTPKTYVANFIGNTNFEGDIQRSVEVW